ncbi:LOW QUALITY PROTEIN: cytochrome P450 2B2-like [Colossoma macropomum]|uniref:LOW QUALITY PROTEIN: cytochrome P450 2B2-like n=1 Tax=Colossoma macropomum TaxID=42526 RepID=UPI0018656723|nr:LOW QUALITY PROTEIN: cytochrome P450 2B2-like [Colossoma macropomum]
MESVLKYLDWTSVGLALLAGLLTLLLLEIFRWNSSRNRSPPGPKPLPFVGNLPQFSKDQMAFIRSLPTYGEMCSIYLGRKPMIILNNMQLAKEAFVENGTVFSGRPLLPLTEWINKGYGIILANYGHSWRQQRRFALHTLRDFGLGKKTVEERVAEEAHYLIKEILKQEGKPFHPIHQFMNAFSNIICSIIFGDRFEYSDKRFAKLLEILNENFQLGGKLTAQIFNLVPIIKYFPGPHQKIWNNFEALKKFLLEIVEEHKKTLDPDNPRDFIDAYLIQMTKQEAKEDSTFHVENMMMSVLDLFVAGTETAATTLRWGLIYMMDHPDVQERCHEEIIQVLGFDRSPCMEDRTQLPYTYATVYEIQRCASITPLGLIHQTTEPALLRGYHLPKGSTIMVNLNAILTDKEHWKYPDTFNPENFLDEKGQFCRNDAFLPFSLGPRVCLGESLAKMELFIFFTSLLQRLKFSWPPGAPRPNMDGIVGVVRSPFPFNTICRSRETTH